MALHSPCLLQCFIAKHNETLNSHSPHLPHLLLYYVHLAPQHHHVVDPQHWLDESQYYPLDEVGIPHSNRRLFVTLTKALVSFIKNALKWTVFHFSSLDCTHENMSHLRYSSPFEKIALNFGIFERDF